MARGNAAAVLLTGLPEEADAGLEAAEGSSPPPEHPRSQTIEPSRAEPSRDPPDDPDLARYLLPRDSTTWPCTSQTLAELRHTADRLAEYAALFSEMRENAREYYGTAIVLEVTIAVLNEYAFCLFILCVCCPFIRVSKCKINQSIVFIHNITSWTYL